MSTRASYHARPMTATYPDLSGRTALVTGASSGIGLGIAEALLQQGMRVGVHYRGQRAAALELCGRFPDRAVALQAELGAEQGCTDLARAQRQEFGACDVLVPPAG